MILTLAWKEAREHQGVWLTMAVMTVSLGLGLAYIVSLEDSSLMVPVAALTILGLAATYGVVCGAMMIAGEHEGGTLVFLDVFLGRRGWLWFGKFVIGVMLVLTQALAVATVLRLISQQPPGWVMEMMGLNARRPDPNVWFRFLPVVTLQAYAWGLMGSTLSHRVLTGAGIGALGGIPICLLGIVTPPSVFFTLQVVAAVLVLMFSYFNFLSQSLEPSSPPEADGTLDSREQFLKVWEEIEREDRALEERSSENGPLIAPEYKEDGGQIGNGKQSRDPAINLPDPSPALVGRTSKLAQARSPEEVLWWLTISQARPVLLCLACGGFVIGLFLSANVQVLWPLVSMVIGIACGVAAFAPEQRDMSHLFLATQHFPLQRIWRFKILFWLTTAVLGATVVLFSHVLHLAFQQAGFGQAFGFQGTLVTLMGPLLFFGSFLACGFCAGQIVVWLCRKTILALLVSFMVAGFAVGMWLPSLLCIGINGWQVWLTPLIMLAATWILMRAWASGRIQERKPVLALIGFASVAVGWALLGFGYRALEMPDVGQPFDYEEYRAELRLAQERTAAGVIHQAVTQVEEGNERWRPLIAEAAALPIGVLEAPRVDGNLPLLKHLAGCETISDLLLRDAREKPLDVALPDLIQVLTLSRTLRNKVPIQSYLAGIRAEQQALNALDRCLTRRRPDSAVLGRVLNELNHHSQETPPPLNCLQAEWFRSQGMMLNANLWSFRADDAPDKDKLPERWLAGNIALSLEMPWEAERKARLWQLVWAGLFRAVETPHWEAPWPIDENTPGQKTATRKLLRRWLPAAQGSHAHMTRENLARLLDASWLADERLFCDVAALCEEGMRARWRIDAARQALALSLYRLDEGTPAKSLQDLVPKYLPAGLPIDPYSGKTYCYRVLTDQDARQHALGVAGQEVLWSTGPDRVDHGARNQGDHLLDSDVEWARGALDLITLAPRWP